MAIGGLRHDVNKVSLISHGFMLNMKLQLKIEQQLPQFPVKGQEFEMTIYLVDWFDELKVGMQVPLKLDLILGETRYVPEALTIDPKTPLVINDNGMCTVKIAINETSMANRHQPYHLRFTPFNSSITSVTSPPMTVVRCRLVIQNKLPEIWYKDEGSRDKFLEFNVQLCDSNHLSIPTKPIPLRITLIYENGHAVFKQDILKLSTDSQDTIDGTGNASIKMRIEDVSRNHQSQPFQIKVEPALPMHQDIAYDTTSSVTVRSKRNKLGKRSIPEPYTADIISADSEESFEPSPKRSCINTPIDQNMGRVLDWTRSVLQVLEALEWQQVGYEAQLDGTLDYSKPLYRCPSCWRYKDIHSHEAQQHASNCSLATLLLVYATQTIYDYESLVKLVETTRTPAASLFNSTPSPTLGTFIYCVLAQLATLDNGVCIGFPAYDIGFNLVGFYQAQTTTTTQVIFCPINNCEGVTLVDIERFEMVAHRAQNMHSPALFNRARYVGDLDKLKENVLFYFWESNKTMLR
ncbi:hypothetical protein THRCLA_11501 [Thraustotheca clavata]|uniref:Uncharacterized protein n=1 Tax=Thraustotheca clavata TaxID=74557 RepID=A0A1V9Y7M8_9STRA|nr:hypothetical protein THRCLA_11501 [Thraustotheca clavata]